MFQLTPFLSCHWVLQRRACFSYSPALRYLYTSIGSVLNLLSFQLSNPIFLNLSSYVRCSKPLTSFKPWLDLFWYVYSSYTGEPRTRPSTRVSHTVLSRGKDHLPRSAGNPKCSLVAFATGMQCWLILSSSTRTPSSL